MQLVVPKRKDLRLYAVLGDRALTPSTIPDLIDGMRNARSSVDKAVSDTQVRLNPVMGIVSNQLRLTRITNVGSLPDFTTNNKFAQTMLPLASGYDAAGRSTPTNETHTVSDAVDGVKLGAGGLINAVYAFLPNKIGQSTVSLTACSMVPLQTYVSPPPSTSYGGNLYQSQTQHKTTGNVPQGPIVASHNAGVGGFYVNVNTALAADANTVMLSWATTVYQTGGARFNTPQKTGTPVLPTIGVATFNGNETNIALNNCIIPILWGNEIRVIKLTNGQDYTADVYAPGDIPTINMNKIDLNIKELYTL